MGTLTHGLLVGVGGRGAPCWSGGCVRGPGVAELTRAPPAAGLPPVRECPLHGAARELELGGLLRWVSREPLLVPPSLVE